MSFKHDFKLPTNDEPTVINSLVPKRYDSNYIIIILQRTLGFEILGISNVITLRPIPHCFNDDTLMGILQNMVNPSLAPNQPEGSELPTFSYGGEGIPRVLKQYRFSPHGYISPIRWSNQLNQPEVMA